MRFYDLETSETVVVFQETCNCVEFLMGLTVMEFAGYGKFHVSGDAEISAI